MKLWEAQWRDGSLHGSAFAVAETKEEAERKIRRELERNDAIRFPEFTFGPTLHESGVHVIDEYTE